MTRLKTEVTMKCAACLTILFAAGTGKGGKSIFKTANGKFADEIGDSLKHNRRGMLSGKLSRVYAELSRQRSRERAKPQQRPRPTMSPSVS